MTSLKTSIKTITYLSDIGCLEIQGASLIQLITHILIAVKTKNSINNQRDIINLPYISTAPEVGLKTLS